MVEPKRKEGAGVGTGSKGDEEHTFGLVEGCAGGHVAHQRADVAGDLGAGKGEGRDEEGGENGGGELHFGGWLDFEGGTWCFESGLKGWRSG